LPKIDPCRVFVFSLLAADLPATAHFYRDVIGLRLLPHHGGRMAFDLGTGVHLVILPGEPPPATDAPGEPFPAIAFEVDDLDAAVENLKAHGVCMPWGVAQNESARWVMLYDPAGNLIELAQLDKSLLS
jgi:catechol 2,3-dioxygenase-like lactoylglutathione lyase family enzyme